MEFSFKDLSSTKNNAERSLVEGDTGRLDVSKRSRYPSASRYQSGNGPPQSREKYRGRSYSRDTNSSTRYNRAPSASRSHDPRVVELKPWNIFNNILHHHGKTLFRNIEHLFPGSMSKDEVKNWLQSDQYERFVVFTDSSDRISYVAVGCRGKLCLQYGQSGCSRSNCGYFHLCRYFVSGQCVEETCSYFHDFENHHNKELVKRYHLLKYNDSQLKTIIQNSLAQVCSNYNKNNCSAENNCTHLHVCEFFITSHSCPKENCDLDHSFTAPHTKKLLSVFKLDKLLVKEDTLKKCILVYRKHDHKNLDKMPYHPRDATSRGSGEAAVKSRYRGGGWSRGQGQRGRGQRGQGQRGQGQRGQGQRCRSASRPREVTEDVSELKNTNDSSESDTKETLEVAEESYSSEFGLEETWAGPRVGEIGRSKYQNVRQKEEAASSLMEPTADRESLIHNTDETVSKHISPGFDQLVRKTNISHLPMDRSNIRQKLQRLTVKEDATRPKVSEMLSTSRNRNPLKVSSSDHPRNFQKTAICVDNLNGKCYKDELCQYLHHDGPYMWSVKVFGEWYEIDKRQEKLIEDRFLVADNDSHTATLHMPGLPLTVIINFDTLSATTTDDFEKLDVKRLSVPTSQWTWYIKGDHFVAVSSSLNKFLEENYLRFDQEGISNAACKTKTGIIYNVDFGRRELKQSNPSEDLVTYPMRRRPTRGQDVQS